MRVRLIAAAIVVVLSGGVALAAVDLMGDEAGAQALVPVDAVALVHATLDPSLDQKRALAGLAERLPEGAGKRLQESLGSALDSALGEVDLEFEQDVKPWLGGEVAVFLQGDLTQPEGAVLLETTDPEAALDVARRIAAAESDEEPTQETYRDHTFSLLPETDVTQAEGAFGIVGDFLVVGTTEGLLATIDASADGGIEDNAEYSEVVGALSSDRLVTYWADTPSIFAALQRQLPADQAEQLEASPVFGQQQPQAGALFVEDDAVVMEAVSAKPDGEAALLQMVPADEGLLAALPQDAWLGLAIPSVGDNLTVLLDSTPDAEQAEQQFSQMTGLDLRSDVLAWMGDAALFVQGDALPSLGGALIVGSDDPEATRTFLQRVVDTGTEQGLAVAPTRAGDLEGFALVDGSAPVRATALAGDRLILAVDSGQVTEAESAVAAVTGDGPTLADTEAFFRATGSLGDDYTPTFFLDVRALTQVVRSAFGQSSTPQQFTEAEQYLQEISHVVAGVRDDGELVVQRVVIGATAE